VRQIDADQPSSEKLHSTPDHTTATGSRRQRTLKITHSTIAMTTIAAQSELEHAALEVVVDLLEVDRRAGDGQIEPVELLVLEAVSSTCFVPR
jgi:hypothetical protein